jgi:hypothetical protein
MILKFPSHKYDLPRFVAFNSLMFLLTASGYANTSTQTNASDNLVDDISEFFSADGIVVSADYYPTAETARQMLETQTKAGGVNRLGHIPVLTPTDMQSVVRMN